MSRYFRRRLASKDIVPLGVMHSDVKFHEIFWHEIFHEIFLKYFKNFTIFFGQYTHPFNIFHMSNIIYLSFIYAYCRSLSLSAGLLAWFACSTLLLTFYQYPLSY